MRAAISVALLLLISGFAIAGGNKDAAVWRLTADEPLLKAYDAGQSPLKIVVQGPQVLEPATTPADRAEWCAHWEAQSAPFFAAVHERVAALGGVVTTEVPAVNAIFVTVPNDRVPALLSMNDVRRAGLDWEGAVRTQSADDLPGTSASMPPP